MVCKNCGMKNKKDTKFCEKCGTKLESNGGETINEKNNSSKKTKIIIVLSVIALILIVVLILVGMSKSNPNKIVKDYMDVYSKNNYSKLYDYINFDDNIDKTFASKKIYEDINKKNHDKENDIKSFTLGDIKYDASKTSATAQVTYTTNKSSNKKTGTIKLKKSKKKKLLFFDKWEIEDIDVSTTSTSVVSKYFLRVPKGAKVEYAGILLTEKYLDKSRSDSKYDTYVLEQVFELETPIKVTLKDKSVVNETVIPTAAQHTLGNMTGNKEGYLTGKEKKDVVNKTKNDILKIYTGLMAGQNCENLGLGKISDDVKNRYKGDLVSIKQAGLTKFNITKVKPMSVFVDAVENVNVYIKMDYMFTTLPTDPNSFQEKFIDSKGQGSSTLVYTQENGKLELKRYAIPTAFGENN